MKRMEPRHAHDRSGLWWRRVSGFIRLPEYESERWAQGAKFRLSNESEVNLEGIDKKKYAVRPSAGDHIEMMQGMMQIVHVIRPISEDTWEIPGSGDTKGEIYIRPFIFAQIGGGASNSGTSDPGVTPGEFQETGAQVSAIFGSIHGCAGRSDVFQFIVGSGSYVGC
jgi:hypothetical protein